MTFNCLLVGAALNLFICAAGAGLLSFPYAVKNQGIIVTIVSTFGIACISLYTDLIYISFGSKYKQKLIDGTLEEIIRVTLGPTAGKISLFTVIVGCFGSVIGFLILIGDVIVPLAEAACGDIESSLCIYSTSRAYMIITFTVVLVLPMSSLSSFSHLALGSAVAVGTLFAVVASVVYEGFSAAISSSYKLPNNSYARPSWTIILGIPIAIFALGNHTQVIQIANEVGKHDCEAGENVHKSVVLAAVGCVIIYLLTGVCGYLAFGNDTEGDVLLNFHIHDKLAAATRSLMALHIALAVPVVVIPLRTICWHYLEPLVYPVRKEILDSKHGELLEGEENRHAPDVDTIDGTPLLWSADEMKSVTPMNWKLLLITTSLIVLPCAGVSIACPQVAIVFGLLGASISTIQIYVFPGCMLLASIDTNNDNASKSEVLPEMRYIPTNSKTRRAHGVGLICFGAVIAVVGTVTFIYSSLASS